MNRAIVLALLLIPLPALAGTTITVSVGDVSEVWTLSDTDQQKFEAWVQTAYKCTGHDCTALTIAESEALWAQATLQGTANNVQQFQNIIASKAAMDATTPVGFATKGSPTSAVVSPAPFNIKPQKVEPQEVEPQK